MLELKLWGFGLWFLEWWITISFLENGLKSYIRCIEQMDKHERLNIFAITLQNAFLISF